MTLLSILISRFVPHTSILLYAIGFVPRIHPMISATTLLAPSLHFSPFSFQLYLLYPLYICVHCVLSRTKMLLFSFSGFHDRHTVRFLFIVAKRMQEDSCFLTAPVFSWPIIISFSIFSVPQLACSYPNCGLPFNLPSHVSHFSLLLFLQLRAFSPFLPSFLFLMGSHLLSLTNHPFLDSFRFLSPEWSWTRGLLFRPSPVSSIRPVSPHH